METILIDMDDTIENLCEAWVEWLNSKYGLDVKVTDITEWDMTKFFPSLTPDEIYEPLKNDEFWCTVQPKADAQKYIKRLQDDGYKVLICTTSNYHSFKSKMENCLFKHFPFISYDQVIVTHHKHLIKGDYLIDDGIHNFEGGDFKKILFTTPANRNINVYGTDIVRVKDWEEIYTIIVNDMFDDLRDDYGEEWLLEDDNYI